ncbi:MAG: DUF1553 domain-containing protein [Bryobacteraceae bacterium]|nr:DUF1553 domain-containing protein [Bryobacteraceae bacterium]
MRLNGGVTSIILSLLAVSAAAQSVEFNRDVRPILSDKCFACHGPDAKTKGIPLRLDVESEAKADRRGRVAIKPGLPDESEIIRRVRAAQPARRMPPAITGHTVTDAEVATLRRWISEGAAWQAHWAFIPPKPQSPPKSASKWARNPIDAFVLARLEREHLAPSPAAAAETLLRRATLDLTGLPPTPVELDAFLRDKSPLAYERALDRLLASPRYGERMAARWLDAARYADTNGYQFDGERQMWRWRDWVIEAFNRNQPFNQFALEQIAGDLLPQPTLDQKIATGFNRNHRGNTEDGIVPEEYAVEYVVDRVETTSTVFLGLTLGCARCHNHKYDPLTQKEFYQFFAYFNNVPENGRAMKYGNSPPYLPAPTAAQQAELKQREAAIAAERETLRRRESVIAAAQSKTKTGPWTPATGSDFAWQPGQPTEAKQAGAFDIRDHFTLSARVKVGNGALLTRMVDRPQGKGYGVYLRDGRVHVHLTSAFADDAIRLDTVRQWEPGREIHVAVTYDGRVAAAGVNVYVDGQREEVKVSQDTLYRPFVNAGAIFKEPLRIGAGGGAENRFAGQILAARVYSRALPADEVAALSGRQSPEFARAAFLESDPGPDGETWRKLRRLLDEKERFERTFPTVMVMAEGPPKQAHILLRGAYDKPGEAVTPGVPAVLPPLPPGLPNNRLGLARWIVSPENPLLARVTVNRFWQMYFGTGLVKTTEDFGTQGEWPSHPELLDWLALEFIRSGWDVKALQKLILSSATYRQSSKVTPELLERDPGNRLLARGPRLRLAPEMIRDAALYSSGLLQESLGGPSVKPYQPAGLWKEISMQDMDYVESRGRDLYRRGLYTFWKRTIAPPMMVNFDAANHESCTVRESRTNTPLQALNLMNDVTFLEAGRLLGQRMLKEGGASPEQRLAYGFRLVTGRRPDTGEVRILTQSLAYHLDYFSSEQAAPYLNQGVAKTDASLKPAQLAAYAAVGNLLLNLDEAVTKE